VKNDLALKLPDDVTNFPNYKHVPIPETIPYQEGKYVPASIPVISGYNNFILY
jgi:hypothetical protein